MVVIFQVGSTSEQNAPVSELVKQARPHLYWKRSIRVV
jgi:hypothetical protein